MPRIPFHRRVLLWVFFIAFVVLAPTVVFYTAGYRWNPKKGVIERNGTLIIDTTPRDALIALNGQRLKDLTPVTLQNVTPGVYVIHLERDGYHSWEKALEVKSERVTFMNNVWLWPAAAPSLELSTNAAFISLSPNQRILSLLESSASGTKLIYYDVVSGIKSETEFSSAPAISNFRITWNGDSSAVFVSDGVRSWVTMRGGTASEIIELPISNYRWIGDRLVGISDGEKIEYSITNGELRRERLSEDVVDQEGGYRLVSTTATRRLSVMEKSRPDRRFELPEGDWRFAERLNGWIFLKTDNTWLGFDPDETKPSAVRLPADGAPSAMRRLGENFLLSRGAGEIWLLRLNQEPELLIRKSQSLRGLAWHRAGFDVFYATPHEFAVLNLDDRNGRRETVLATFDDIKGFAVTRGFAYVAGEKDGKRGLWKIKIE